MELIGKERQCAVEGVVNNNMVYMDMCLKAKGNYFTLRTMLAGLGSIIKLFKFVLTTCSCALIGLYFMQWCP